MMGKLLIAIIISLILIPVMVSAKQLTITPGIIDTEYTLGTTTQPVSVTLTLTNNDNTTFDVSLSASSEILPFISITPSTLSFAGNSSRTFAVIFNIPQNTTARLYHGYVYYDGTAQFIPLYINVKPAAVTVKTEGCRLILPSREYAYTIKRGTKSYTQDYLFKISKECLDVDVTDFQVSNTVLMESGYEPIRLIGASPKNTYEGGDTVTYTLEFDVTGLETGTYTPSIFLSALTDDEAMNEELKFKITVTSVASSITNDSFSTLPSCSLLTNEPVGNQSTALVCNNVINPNLQVNVVPNVAIRGDSPEVRDTQFVWHYTPTLIGNTEIQVYFTYKGVPIGDVQTFPIRVIPAGQSLPGTNIKIEMFPPLESITAGTPVNFLAKDERTGNIISASFYNNGMLMTSNTFTPMAGSTYTIAASAPGYMTSEQKISVSNLPVVATLSSTETKIGSSISIIVEPSDATITINGAAFTGTTFTPQAAGTYEFAFSKAGLETTTQTLTVKDKVSTISSIPDKISRGESTIIDLSREAEWGVYYTPKEGGLTPFAQNKSNKVSFVPDKGGTYTLYIEEEKIKEWKVGSYTWLVYTLGGIIIILLLFLIIRGIKNVSKNKVGYGASDIFAESGGDKGTETLH